MEVTFPGDGYSSPLASYLHTLYYIGFLRSNPPGSGSKKVGRSEAGVPSGTGRQNIVFICDIVSRLFGSSCLTSSRQIQMT